MITTEDIVYGVAGGIGLFAGWSALTGALKASHRKGFREGVSASLPVDNPCGCGHARSFHEDLIGACYAVTVRAKYEEYNHTCACQRYAQAPLNTDGLFPS